LIRPSKTYLVLFTLKVKALRDAAWNQLRFGDRKHLVFG
jgi:hypothetical protein